MTERRSPEEEAVIELTEMVKPSVTDNGGIIELTEMVANESPADEDIIELTDMVNSPQAAENEVIDLVDVVEKAPETDAAACKEADLFDSLEMKLEPELQGESENDELDFNLSTQELSDAIDLLDAKLAEDAPAESENTEPFPLTITATQLEKALENVIRQMYGEKIDLILNQAIDKTVSAEIENLKNQLLKESPEN